MKPDDGKVVPSADEHPELITEAHITHGKMLSIDERDTKYRKRDKNSGDVYIVNKNLTDSKQAALGDMDE